jgi:hypothetical protein
LEPITQSVLRKKQSLENIMRLCFFTFTQMQSSLQKQQTITSALQQKNIMPLSHKQKELHGNEGLLP